MKPSEIVHLYLDLAGGNPFVALLGLPLLSERARIAFWEAYAAWHVDTCSPAKLARDFEEALVNAGAVPR